MIKDSCCICKCQLDSYACANKEHNGIRVVAHTPDLKRLTDKKEIIAEFCDGCFEYLVYYFCGIGDLKVKRSLEKSE